MFEKVVISILALSPAISPVCCDRQVRSEVVVLRGPFKVNHTIDVVNSPACVDLLRVSLSKFGGSGKLAVNMKHAGEPDELGPLTLSVVGMDKTGEELFEFETVCTDERGASGQELYERFATSHIKIATDSQPEFRFPMQSLNHLAKLRLRITRH